MSRKHAKSPTPPMPAVTPSEPKPNKDEPVKPTPPEAPALTKLEKGAICLRQAIAYFNEAGAKVSFLPALSASGQAVMTFDGIKFVPTGDERKFDVVKREVLPTPATPTPMRLPQLPK